mmetsp:Transcript_6835/g.6139  ORF Transcript_6835/g.6139 Transcript_6835/m.6139 type:complete len:119 (-) Transcript_6835:8-364(-)
MNQINNITNNETNKRQKKSKLYNDLEEMMYGFGDKWPPNNDSVNIMEKLVVNYVEELTMRALLVSEITGKLDKECYMYLVRKDRKKFNRIHKLLVANDEIKSVQKVDTEHPFTNDFDS